MTKKVIKLKSRIWKADTDDVHKGWIRVSDDLRGNIPNGAYVKVTANNKKISCQVRGTPDRFGRVEMNEWYRNAFGWTDPPNVLVELTVKEVGSLGRINAWSSHPEDIVRVGIALGMMSVGLGLLSVVLSLLPPSITLMASTNSADSAWGFIGLIIGLILVPVVVFILSAALWTFFRKFPKPAVSNNL